VCTEFATNDPAPTLNPWDPRRTPGGSSPGSAVAVATGMCFASLDTQTAGDIVRPAAYNGIVGFKPTLGRISHDGMINVAWSIDTPGVQARTVADVTALYGALAEGASPAASPSRPPRLGIVRDDLFRASDTDMTREPDRMAAVLADKGAQVGELRSPEPLELAHAAHRIVTFAECAALHEDRYARSADRLGPKFRALIELGLVTPATAYLRAQRVRKRIADSLQRMFEHCDVLLAPTVSDIAPLDRSTTGDSSFQIPWTFCGFPTLSLPTGLGADGMPLAVQLIGRPFGEARLLDAAAWCEAVLGVRLRPPASTDPSSRTTS
jgi:Asp-tRNA(Asn)/Glu-tRNA(Gln) amidotransferase A subunit family amidase